MEVLNRSGDWPRPCKARQQRSEKRATADLARRLLHRPTSRGFPAVGGEAQQAASQHAPGVQSLASAEVQHQGLVGRKPLLGCFGQSLLDQATLADPGFTAQDDDPPTSVATAGIEQASEEAT